MQKQATDLVARVHGIISEKLGELSELFHEDAECTFIMHVPGNPEQELVVSNSDPQQLIDVLKRTKARYEGRESGMLIK